LLNTVFYYSKASVVANFENILHPSIYTRPTKTTEFEVKIRQMQKKQEHYFTVVTFILFDSNEMHASAGTVRWESLQ